MMVAKGHVAAGEKVLILGASGGVGVCCVQLAKLAGATVIAATSSAEKATRLRALGADDIIGYAQEDFVQAVYARYGKPARRGAGSDRGLDVVVNYTGGNTWTRSLRILSVGGRLLTCGATAGYDPPEDIRFIWTFELQILGSNGWAREDVTALLDLVQAGELQAVIDETFPLRARGGSAAAPGKPASLWQTDSDAMTSPRLGKDELQQRLAHSAFIDFLNLTVISADPEKQEVVMRAAMRPEFERGRGSGQWHGGPIAAIIDTVGDYALVMLLSRQLPTVNFRVDYLRPAINTALTITGRVRRSGRLVGVVDIDVVNEAGQLVAIGRATYATAAE